MHHPAFIARVFLFLLFTSVALPQNSDLSVPKRSLITQPVDNAQRTTLAGNTRSAAKSAVDEGLVPDSLQLEHLLLQLKRPAEMKKALDQFVVDVQNPTSPKYHQWLTAADFGAHFGLAQTDLDKVTDWLESQGFVVNKVYANKVTVDFSGTAGQVRQAFKTEIHYLENDGERHIANISDPQIPSALAPAVEGIVSLHNFMPRPMRTDRAQYTVGSGTENVVPGDLATIYNLNPLFAQGITGQGQTIVAIEDSNVYNTNDWTTFRNIFGLSSYSSGSFSQTHPGNCSNPGAVAGNDAEATLDAEWSSAVAPGAAIQLASCSDTATTFGGLIALQNLLNASATPPALVSISYGECEAENGASANATYAAAYEQAVAEGVSVFVSSGDEGAASCDGGGTYATHGIGVSAFASTPYNVAVGGTDFSDTYTGTTGNYWNSTNTSTYESAKSYIPEIPWDDSCANSLIAGYFGYSISWGASGFCNSSTGKTNFINLAAGSGGPSGCATGSPSSAGVVSGSCAGYAKPGWQSGIFGNPGDGVRDIPDVALFAANGVWGHYYIFCWTDTANGGASCSGAPSTWSGAGGTSFSSPIMAGIQALVNQKTSTRWGNPNPYYYALAATEYGSAGNSSCLSSSSPSSACTFYDVTQGDMDVVCGSSIDCYGSSGKRPNLVFGVLSTSSTSLAVAYPSGNGWDFATGLGSVNATNLVNNWNGGSGSGGSGGSGGSSSATYTGLDTATQGTWTGVYGADGYLIANDAMTVPGYASVSLGGDATYTWVSPTTDPRALQTYSGSSTRLASTYFASSSFTINVNITDGSTRRLALYLLDWDSTVRSETITIKDATNGTTLSSESFAGFNGGEYAVWNIQGNVVIQVTCTGGANAVVSGIFFGAGAAATPPSSSATYSGLDTTTQGAWTGQYGSNGEIIANGINTAASFASISFTGDSPYTWAQPTSDPRALQSSSGSSTGIASCYFAPGSYFDISLNLTDGNTHRIALYLLDWDSTVRGETITIMDAATNTVLSTETLSGFHNGEYAVWNVKGNVVIQVLLNTGANAVVSGIFID